jgi:hypothetical protein
MDGKTGAHITLFITGLRPALWPSIAEEIQLWRQVSALFRKYPGLFAWRQNGGSISLTATEY